MSRLEELQKAVDDAREELKKADAAWDAWVKAKRELNEYLKEQQDNG